MQTTSLEVEGLITCVNHPTVTDLDPPLHDFMSLPHGLDASDGIESRLTLLHHHADDQLATMQDLAIYPHVRSWPSISVVVYSYNRANTICDSLESLSRLSYPTYEVIVVDDGSTDTTASIVQTYGVRFISTEHRGLSNARNTGMQAAQGEIVAYMDAGAYPSPHWLYYLAATFMCTSHVGVGGPCLLPDGCSWIADCVANAPGGPVYVLPCDRDAAHMSGCNMAFRKSTLQSIGGFSPRYHTTGDEVDVCWRLQRRGWTLGFHPEAVLWHRDDYSIRTYWNLQKGHGGAEILLEEKWPLAYREFGYLAWAGRLHSRHLNRTINLRQANIPQGGWSHLRLQPFQASGSYVLPVLPLMPAWYLLAGALTVLALLSLLWSPLRYSLPCLMIAIAAPLVQAVLRGTAAIFTSGLPSPTRRLKYGLLTVYLHLLQPIARLHGRLNKRLTRRRGHQRLRPLWPRTITIWRERHRASIDPLQFLETTLCDDAIFVQQGSIRDRWDLEVRGGLFGKVQTRMIVTAQETNQPSIRFRAWPMGSIYSVALSLLFALLCMGAILDHAYASATILGCVVITVIYRMLQESAWAMSNLLEGFKRLGARE
jgi:GT2 family glycosyltransferase